MMRWSGDRVSFIGRTEPIRKVQFSCIAPSFWIMGLKVRIFLINIMKYIRTNITHYLSHLRLIRKILIIAHP